MLYGCQCTVTGVAMGLSTAGLGSALVSLHHVRYVVKLLLAPWGVCLSCGQGWPVPLRLKCLALVAGALQSDLVRYGVAAWQGQGTALKPGVTGPMKDHVSARRFRFGPCCTDLW